jgi:myo-inositol-1(or 4)-monophosphatase
MTSSALDVPFTPDLHELERLAVELVTDAAADAAAAFGRQIEVQQKPYKDGTQPVTALDRSIEQTVGAAVRTRYPEHAVVGEEFGNVGEERDWCWIVDPIDGTHNFVNGVPMFAVSLGVLFRRRPVVGAIAVPANQSVLHGQIGGPVNWGGDPVEVSQAQMPFSGIGVVPPDLEQQIDAPHGAAGIPGDHRWLGSTAYEMAMVARGTFDFGVFNSADIWDVAAGLTLILGAGGVVLRPDSDTGGWRDFDAFPPAPAPLHTWNEPLIAGGPGVRALAAGLRPR